MGDELALFRDAEGPLDLEQQRTLLATLVDAAPVAILLVDGEGRIALVNREVEKLFGHARDALLGQPIEMLVPQGSRVAHPSWRKSYSDAPRARPMGAGRALHGVRRDGTRVPVEIALQPVATGRGTHTLAVVVDLSERRQLERRFEAVVESAPTAMVMTDQHGRILLVNRETERMFGYARQELLGDSVERLVPLRFRSAHPQLRDGYFAQPEVRRMGAGRELYGLRKDGSEVPIEIGLNPIQTDDGLVVLSAIVDIEERKRLDAARQENLELEERVRERTAELARHAEDLQRANQALERSNMELREFAYVASHDLQSPLRSISGFVQLLQRRYRDVLDAQALGWIESAVQAAGRMSNLIRDLLEYSHIDSRARPFQPVQLGEVVDDALDMLAASIADARATVVQDALPTVPGDRSQLVQLFQNLIGNAIKYHGPELPVVHIRCRENAGELRVSVTDNGIGIPPEQRERVFELFRRLHSTQTYPGTGIGLAVARRVVERHGGRIWIEPESAAERGPGTTFTFTLLLAQGDT